MRFIYPLVQEQSISSNKRRITREVEHELHTDSLEKLSGNNRPHATSFSHGYMYNFIKFNELCGFPFLGN